MQKELKRIADEVRKFSKQTGDPYVEEKLESAAIGLYNIISRLDMLVSLHNDENTIRDNWDIISDLGWGTKSVDYKKLGEALKLSYPNKIYELREFVRDKQKLLMNKLNEYADIQGNRRTYWKVGDDGFSDLTAHIIGLGKEKYEEVCNNPAIAWTIKYKESFLYVFH